jgi:hypothetical protein
MDCPTLQQQVVSMTINAPLYRNSAADLQNYQNTLDSINNAISSKCTTGTPVAGPTVTPQPQINILPGNAAPMGGGGGGGGDQPANPVAQAVKNYWWLGLIAVGVAFLLYKPGMKPGVIK